ncbi:uncharacterized protein METZ01_LOCUS410359, partial [marine metagenome]
MGGIMTNVYLHALGPETLQARRSLEIGARDPMTHGGKHLSDSTHPRAPDADHVNLGRNGQVRESDGITPRIVSPDDVHDSWVPKPSPTTDAITATT